MKAKVVVVLAFVTLFITGVSVIDKSMPQDDANQTVSYAKETSVYTPPSVNIVDKFDAGGMSLATIGMVGYKQISSTKGSENFMSTSIFGGG